MDPGIIELSKRKLESLLASGSFGDVWGEVR